ncbi:hypothetical protein AK812_SmicGene19535 [Symbiodinium microadriaticum]|uniref:Uncharacterized protein n=1 Tax=Symbiodinium microadriaticum TaxID=2951 RepID=A0A1Q9DSA8_SYMMI|nr:hypothetical protein AK812_SmicGene19535 [Symbiodinium microadriaticum]
MFETLLQGATGPWVSPASDQAALGVLGEVLGAVKEKGIGDGGMVMAEADGFHGAKEPRFIKLRGWLGKRRQAARVGYVVLPRNQPFQKLSWGGTTEQHSQPK